MCTRVERPVVSIIMGVFYRRESIAYLQRAVNSLLSQTYGNFELLISDDGSTQEAVEYLNMCARQDPRILLIRGVRNTSLPAKLNACLTVAKGNYIARMDDDDFSHPDRIEKQVAFLGEHPQIAFAGCCINLMTQHGVIGQKHFPARPVVKNFYMTQPYIHPTLIFRRGALDAVGAYSESPVCDHCEDYDLLLRLYAKGYVGANLQEILLDYTVPNARGNRTIHHRINEVVTRYRRFRELHCLPWALPFVVKPIVVGLLPSAVLARIKRFCFNQK